MVEGLRGSSSHRKSKYIIDDSDEDDSVILPRKRGRPKKIAKTDRSDTVSCFFCVNHFNLFTSYCFSLIVFASLARWDFGRYSLIIDDILL